jgi:hypothetical protein
MQIKKMKEKSCDNCDYNPINHGNEGPCFFWDEGCNARGGEYNHFKLKEIQEYKMDKDKYKLSKETAQAELQKMLDYYEIDIDEIEDKELKKAIKAGYDRLIKAVRLERLQVITEDGIKIIQKLKSNGSTVEYREIDGKSKMAMAGKDEKDYYGKSYALMGSLSGLGENVISNMKGVDLSLVETLGMIFLAV